MGVYGAEWEGKAATEIQIVAGFAFRELEKVELGSGRQGVEMKDHSNNKIMYFRISNWKG
jgi:hypothetical protein